MIVRPYNRTDKDEQQTVLVSRCTGYRMFVLCSWIVVSDTYYVYQLGDIRTYDRTAILRYNSIVVW